MRNIISSGFTALNPDSLSLLTPTRSCVSYLDIPVQKGVTFCFRFVVNFNDRDESPSFLSLELLSIHSLINDSSIKWRFFGFGGFTFFSEHPLSLCFVLYITHLCLVWSFLLHGGLCSNFFFWFLVCDLFDTALHSICIALQS